MKTIIFKRKENVLDDLDTAVGSSAHGPDGLASTANEDADDATGHWNNNWFCLVEIQCRVVRGFVFLVHLTCKLVFLSWNFA